MKLPSSFVRSMAVPPCICSFPAATVPSAFALMLPRHARGRDDELLSILRRFGGTPAAIMQRPELMAALLPALRADLALVEGYTVDPGTGLLVRSLRSAASTTSLILALCSPGRDYTHGKFRTRIFPGGHFYFSPAAGLLAKEIVEDLRSIRGHARGQYRIADMTHPCVDH